MVESDWALYHFLGCSCFQERPPRLAQELRLSCSTSSVENSLAESANRMKFTLQNAAIGILTGLLCACTSENTPDQEAPTGAEGQLESLTTPALNNNQLTSLSGEAAMLRLLITDAPVEADNVFVTFCGIHILSQNTESDSSDAGADNASADAATEGEESASAADADEARSWLTVSDECQTHDLLALQDGIAADMGLESLPAGSYGQIRLMLTEARIVVQGEEHPLTIPSATQSGIKIGHGFELRAGSLTTLALDFDAARSIHETGGAGYMMRPVVELAGERTERFAEAVEREAARENSADQDKDDGANPSDAGTPGQSMRESAAEPSSGGSAEAPRADNASDQRARPDMGNNGRGMPEPGAADQAAP